MHDRNIEKFSSLWAKQLHVEFEDICWQYNINLRAPVFEISQSEKQLGSWHPGIRTVKISSFLIANHSWSVTIAVLKHEMAHQICSEIYHSHEVAHGEAFNVACSFLGLPEEYRRASGDLPENVTRLESGMEPTSNARRFIDKVEKLLSLAKSSNEHEASLAMRKANELIEKYNIGQLGNHDVRYFCVIIDKKKKRIETYQRQICSILRDFFYVKIVNSDLYDPLVNQTYKTIELLGTVENTTIAEYCYYFLENQLASLWSQNKSQFNGNTRTEKNSYYLGILNGFYVKLRRNAENSQAVKAGMEVNCRDHTKTVCSLIVAEDKKLREFVGMKFPRLSSISTPGPKIYKNTYAEGVEAGGKITFHKGVSSTDGNKANLLTA